MKFCFLTCWFGPYPWYFPYFIHSCSYNLTVDFIIITDNQETFEKPENVKIINKTLGEIKTIATKSLGFPVKLDFAYKLCDFKPAYGFLFPDIIKDYAFWGQTDLDIILGNIRAFITDEMLDAYDFINMRHDYTTGCFALYRNTEQMNTFFMRSKDYKAVFSASEYMGFDECSFAFGGLENGKSIFEIPTQIESFTHLIKAADGKKEINAHFDFILLEGTTGRVTFDNGRVFYKKELEAILYHLVRFKKNCVIPKKIGNIPSYYRITPTKILHHRKKKKNVYGRKIAHSNLLR
jgi:hypothetical protein